MVEKCATGGLVRFDAVQLNSIASDITAEPSRWVAPLVPVIPPEGMKLTVNFEAGFTADLTPAAIEAFRSLTAGALVDPRVDEE